MFFGINGTELVIICIVALLVIGPRRIPEYAAKLRDFVKQIRRFAEGAKESVRKDLGDDFADYDWQALDPRQYDPRRIVREALAEESAAIRRELRAANPLTPSSPQSGGVGSTEADEIVALTSVSSPLSRFAEQAQLRESSGAAPFDPEAT